ncbi:OLC1v1030219C1 [Oldenlandia corymbosa var. corymbosa]|uniref:OLC1v1030219C1 n=1 Tax=Oldenlandia corymbosa var. corymbosa TaxID=529605 RepID=A0AAV1CH40_OLDCO|nr:OLC1v1030219C1 [Oldenlandia corymbosa var. corymbosa]
MSLVGKFAYGRPKMKEIHKEFKKFGFNGAYTLGLMNPRHILIQYECEDDYQYCWMQMFWNVAGFSMRILKWKPGFKFEEDLPIVPIWVSVCDLPIEFLNPEVIFSMATVIGKPLKVDAPTLNMTRPSVARFCVEVDLTKELPKFVKIGKRGRKHEQFFTYENVPFYCSKCFKIGHKVEDCKKGLLLKKGMKGKQQSQDHGNKPSKPAQPQAPPSRAWVSKKPMEIVQKNSNSAVVCSSSGLTKKEKAATVVDVRDSPQAHSKCHSKEVLQKHLAGRDQACGNPSSVSCEAGLNDVAPPPSRPEFLGISVEEHEPLPVITLQTSPQQVVLQLESMQTQKTLEARSDNRFALLSTIDEADCEDVEEEKDTHIENVYVENIENTTSVEVEYALQWLDSEDPLCIENASDDGTIDKGLFHEDVKVSRKRGSKSKAEKAELLKGVITRRSPRELGFDYAFSSENSKIWVFSRHGFMLTLLEDLDQILHFEVTNALANGTFYLSTVYAKSTKVERRLLWQHMIAFRQHHPSAPWMIGGDFNVIRTWMNILELRFRTWQPSQNLMNAFLNANLMIFRFQKMWLRRPEFLAMVKQNWDHPYDAFGMLRFSLKLRRLKAKLKEWNKETFGDVFANLKAAEKKVQDLEGVYDSTGVIQDRVRLNAAKANLLMKIKEHDDFWSQKMKIKWMKEGDSNTSFFHASLKERRGRQGIFKIQAENGDMLTRPLDIEQEVISFFSALLNNNDVDPLSDEKQEMFVHHIPQAMTRRLKSLVAEGRVAAYGTPVGSLPVTHLAFADDVIVFSRGLKRSLKELNSFLMDYEIASSQKVSRSKSSFVVAENCNARRVVIIQRELGIQRETFPFTYLGCKLYLGRRRASTFQFLLDHLDRRLLSWENKMLS